MYEYQVSLIILERGHSYYSYHNINKYDVHIHNKSCSGSINTLYRIGLATTREPSPKGTTRTQL